MAENKKQHYIPQFYMKEFSQDGSTLFVYNLKNKKDYKGKIKNLCQSKYFYDHDLKLEALFSKIESEQAPILKEINKEQNLNFLTSDIFYHLRLFILLQGARTKYEKELSNQTSKELSSKIIQKIMKADDGLQKNEWIDFFKVSIQTALEEVNSIIDLEYVLLINKTKKKFIFSDDPIVFYNYKKIKNRSATGYKSKGLQIFIPLSDKIILTAIDNNMYNIIKTTPTSIIITKEEDIDSLNKLQFFNCLENVFFSEKADIGYVETLYSQIEDEIDKRKAIVETVNTKELSNKGKRELYVQYRTDILYKLKLSFIKLNGQASMEYKGLIKKLSEKDLPVDLARTNEINETIGKIILNNIKHGNL